MSDARAIYKAAFASFLANRLDEAIDGFRRALALDPTLALAWNGLSKSLERKGDVEGALEAARRLAELEPADPLSHTNLSQLYQRQGRIPEAEEAKATAMRLQMKQQGR
ncbi:MAG TPA: tetratricopeptide repeat protein [Myxococcota bacterium]|jgi:Flp pilus assembly protein TadD|nr:tetratricopeptide repeat protein [Myxococcota bacterium]